ncbi:UDP-galactose transporter senju isoform X2 [Leguminivora glycinivorella]|uniref:UDP-galactose transporter senju isoform X2 n=1 Tax=Leguminivora glycinivorella TaxID=1035111 RepID=UPI00200FA31F|nr:UDP-galactose transporter senju isoform X2 [Leguminivora glycinivorella]
MKELQNLFPNKEGFITFALYIILFVFQGVFVTASKNAHGGYSYNTTLVVFLTELLKLVASATLYSYRRNDKPHIFRAVALNYKLLLLYFIPSLLYCFYNNLAFVNLSHYDPTSYYILLQFRVVLTAILFQCLFQRKLTLMQWVSLGILTLGCILKNFDAASVQSKTADASLWSHVFNIYFLSINFQNFCSCLAGTYNEYLLKKQGASVDIFLQNVFMYLDSVICNFFILMLKGELGTVFDDFSSLANIFVILIIVNSAVVGIVTSFFLKNLNSILKTYASALELIITAVVCYLLFNILITWGTVISICLVSIAVGMYMKNPVNNAIIDESAKGKDQKPLLEEV